MIILFGVCVLCLILVAGCVQEAREMIVLVVVLIPSELCAIGVEMTLTHRLLSYMEIIQEIVIMDFFLFFFYLLACLLIRLGFVV